MAPSCFGWLSLKRMSDFFLFVNKCNGHMKMLCPSNAWCKILIRYVDVNATLEGANENHYLVMQMPFMWMQMRVCMHMMQVFTLGMSNAKTFIGYANMNATIWWCKMKISWFEMQMFSRKMYIRIFSYDANVWDINQLYL